ncbi:MAG: hypothetical protein N2C14_10305, partial [Planctomycetales bacterium]
MRINCGVWRYHPVRKQFEIVAHGTTNPWGLDFNDHGEAFITNCVIGHLWHVIPGAHYQRMHGKDYNPHVYGLLGACSDHLHWGGGKWTSSRGGQGIHSLAGGGHAHSGAMVYLGDNWPRKYRGTVMTCNLHGNRVNHDLLHRQGSGYVGKHAKDFLLANDPWFRGLELKYGPDGAVYVTDWSDTGECHERDAHGSHHDSGRIYKITHGQPKSMAGLDLAKKTNRELAALQLHRNDWHVRHARRLLHERAAAGDSMQDARQALAETFQSNPDVTRKLRAMWALRVTGGADAPWLLKQLEHPDEYVQAWAIRFLCEDKNPSDAALEKFLRLGKESKSALVRLYLASALQRIPLGKRWGLARALLAHEEDATDQNLPLMLWYGVEPL